MFKFLRIFILLFPYILFAQTKVEIKGIIKDESNIALESVTVFVNKSSDGSLVDYSITNSKGEFVLSLKPSNEEFVLKASLIGMQEFAQTIKLDKSQSFPNIILKDDSNLLGELVITAEAPPVRVKTDTLEFNAASFKVMPDANVEALLKQLPGVLIDGEGKITVNGKEVNQILVNGKPFFGKDGKVALQNLPADLIQKVQVSDTKTKMEEFTKQQASSDNSSINLTIDEKKNTGYFGKINLGYGTNDRYESGLMANYFKNKTKLSVIASSNNINSSGFSMDEVFDNMSGGRSGASTGGGITTTHTAGINYDDEWFDNFEVNGSYNFNQAENENSSRSRRINFLTDGNFITTSENRSNTLSRNHIFNTTFEYKIADKIKLYYSPTASISNRESDSFSNQSTMEEDETLQNENISNSFSNSKSKNFSNNFLVVKSFDKKGRRFSLDLGTNNNKSDQDTRLNSETYFYTTNTNDLRNQLEVNRSISDSYSFAATYAEPISDSLKIEVSMDFRNDKSVNDQNTFDFLNGSFTDRNDFLSNYVRSDSYEYTPTAGVILDKKKHNFKAIAGTRIFNYNALSDYLQTTTNLNRDYLLPTAHLNYSYKPSRGKMLRLRYRYNTSLPNARQLLPFENLSNPLNTITGNPDLDASRSHNTSVTFRWNNQVTKSSYNIFSSFIYNDKSIISVSNFDENRKRYTTYANIDGTYSAYLSAGWYKTKKNEAHNFGYGININNNYNYTKGYVNNAFYDSRQINISPQVFFSYEYGEILKVFPSYSFGYNIANYDNYVVKNASNTVHRFKLQTTTYWPKNLIWGNDFNYTYNSNLASFKADFYMWNTSLAYYFLDKSLLAKVKVYDILNQNIGNSRTVSETYVVDQENLVLKQYVMFSLTYKLDKFGGKSMDKEINKNNPNKGRRNNR